MLKANFERRSHMITIELRKWLQDNQFLSAVTATASILKQELNPKDLMQTIIDKFDQHSTRFGTKEKNTNVTFFAGSNNQEGRATKKSNKEIECFNCHKKGHKKVDCWAKGGRKEGQGPRTKAKKEELKKEAASVVVEEGVWLAAIVRGHPIPPQPLRPSL